MSYLANVDVDVVNPDTFILLASIWSARSIGSVISVGSRTDQIFPRNILQSSKHGRQTPPERCTMCAVDRYGQLLLLVNLWLAQLRLTAPGGPLEGRKAVQGKSCDKISASLQPSESTGHQNVSAHVLSTSTGPPGATRRI